MENDRSHYLLGNWIKNGNGFRERGEKERESRIRKNRRREWNRGRECRIKGCWRQERER
jgi:hypothetical protein